SILLSIKWVGQILELEPPTGNSHSQISGWDLSPPSQPAHELINLICEAGEAFVPEIRVDQYVFLRGDLVVSCKLSRGRADVVHQACPLQHFRADAGREVLDVNVA